MCKLLNGEHTDAANRKMSLLSWMARRLSSLPAMLPKSSGEVLSIMWVWSKEDEVAMGKVGKESCLIDSTKILGKEHKGYICAGNLAVPETILWPHWGPCPPTCTMLFVALFVSLVQMQPSCSAPCKEDGKKDLSQKGLL